MTKQKKSIKTAKTTADVIKDSKATISNEFVIEGQDWRGQTVEVESETKLEADKGTGIPVIIRSFQFATNPQAFEHHKPTAQEIFDSHRAGISAMLWTDGLRPIESESPRLVFAKDNKSYMIFVTCTTGLGQTLIETPKTLSEIANVKQNTNQLSRSI